MLVVPVMKNNYALGKLYTQGSCSLLKIVMKFDEIGILS